MDEQSRKTRSRPESIYKLNTFLIALGFLSPALAYSTTLLLEEFKDPLGDYHDFYQMNKFSEVSTSTDHVNREKLRLEPFRVFGVQLTKLEIAIWISFCIFVMALVRLSSAIPIIILFSTVTFLLIRKRNQSRGKANEHLISLELPAIVELFAILVSSGESPTSSLSILSKVSSGETAKLLKHGAKKLRSGVGLISTLDEISTLGRVPELRRFCDSLIIATQRGTSLADILNRQVSEIRTRHHARLVESAGKAEIALMVPVVFLILPISVLFALWPSYVALGQSVAF